MKNQFVETVKTAGMTMATASSGGGAKDEAAMLDMAEHPDETFERRRDARWVYRWRVGLTERTTQTQAAAQAAAQRLGATL